MMCKEIDTKTLYPKRTLDGREPQPSIPLNKKENDSSMTLHYDKFTAANSSTARKSSLHTTNDDTSFDSHHSALCSVRFSQVTIIVYQPEPLVLVGDDDMSSSCSLDADSLHSSEDYTHPKTIVAHVDAFEQDRRPKRRRCREELRILQENSPHIPLPERIKMHTRKKRFEIVDEQSAIHKRLCKAASKFFKSIFNLKKRKGRNNTTYIPKEQIDPIVESQGRYQYYLMKSA